MKNLFYLFRKIILAGFLLTIFFSKIQIASANTMNNFQQHQENVIEHLRIRVPNEFTQAWLLAEKGSWEPWLAQKNGFLGRQLLLDRKNEQATLLISWSSREQWKNIPQKEIENIQESFENIARKETGLDKGNPFPLLFEGELLLQ